MKEFIEIAIHDIMEHAKNVSNAAKSNCLKEAYLMGAEHACDVLKVFTESNDVQIVVFCRNCVFWNEKTVFGNEGRKNNYCDISCKFVKETDFCSDARKKEAD